MIRKGFTLIELLVVISIISILSSIVLASLNTARERGRMGAARQFEASLYHTEADQAVGIWDFDDCSTTVASDRSGNNKNGTLTSALMWSSNTPSGTGCSLSFDGSSYFVDTGLTSPSGSVTYSAWILVNDTVNADRYVHAVQNSGFAGGRLLRMAAGATNRIQFEVINDTPATFDANFDGLSAGVWHHVAGVLDTSTNYVSLYVDGSIKASTVVSGTFSTQLSNHKIGRRPDSATLYLNGLVDNVRVFNKSLSAAEIGRLYAEGVKTHKFSER